MAGEWREVKFSSLCDISRGASPRPIHEWISKEGIPWVKIADATSANSRFIDKTGECIRSSGRSKSVVVFPGDLILSNSATPGIPMFMNIEACIHDGWMLLRNFRGLNKQFAYYLLLFNRPSLVNEGNGSVFTNLKTDILKNFPVRIPPESEQRVIAHILGTLDDKIELNRRMNETLESMAQALFKSWFVDFDPVRAKADGRDPGLPKPIADLFPDSFQDSELGEIPNRWKVSQVGEHMTNFDSKRIPVSGRERLERRGPYPYHGAAGVMDYVDKYIFDGTYLLVGEDGSVVNEDGTAVTQYVWNKFWVNNHAHVLQGKGSVSTEQLYLYYQFEQVAPYVTGAVQPKLSQGRMNSMPFLYAGSSICTNFGRIIKPLFVKIRANFEEIESLQTLRDTLLPKLISGELRVDKPERFLQEAS
jgi:type I restriction enzyme S subunit